MGLQSKQSFVMKAVRSLITTGCANIRSEKKISKHQFVMIGTFNEFQESPKMEQK